MRKSGKRGVSAGTIFVLILMLLVLAGTVLVIMRLSSGEPIDLTRLRPAEQPEENPASETTALQEIPAATEPPVPAATPVPAGQAPEDQGPRNISITFAGTVALAGEVRTNSYYSDVKQYDFYDTMTLLKKELQSDLNVVFLENILSEEGKTSDTVATNAAAAMLKAAGFNTAACGFSRAFDKAESGIAATRKILGEHGIVTVGIYESSAQREQRILEVNGIRIALLEYTGTISADTRKKMTKQDLTWAIPYADAETIAGDIAAAKAQGCDVVIVLLNWGKVGKAPDKAQRTLAQKIADAGADLIVGNGSRIVSGAEMLTAADSGRQILCVWSLGTTLSGDRSGIKRIAGMLLHITITSENGHTEIGGFVYTPLYTWKYKMDGRYYYRCMAANMDVPDGMDAEQQKKMKQAAETVRKAMKDTPAEERTHE